MKITLDHASRSFPVNLIPGKSGKSYRVALEDESMEVELISASNGKLDMLIDGKRVTAYVSSQNAKLWVTVNGQTLILAKSSGSSGRGHGHHRSAGELTAPMPGQVRAVNVNEGDKVTKGQTLMLLEAMKMEIRIQSPQDGTVKKLFVKQGQSVEREQMLIEVVDMLEG